MKNVSLPFKIGILLFLAIVIVISIGYLSYRSLQEIVSSIHLEAKPDYTFASLKEISLELEKAENSIRLYSLSKSRSYLNNYYDALDEIDSKISQLRENANDQNLLYSLDTLSMLIAEKQYIWNEMLLINQDDVLAEKLKSITDTLLKKDTLQKITSIEDTLTIENKAKEEISDIEPEEEELGFFQRLFRKKPEEPPEEEQQAVRFEKPAVAENSHDKTLGFSEDTVGETSNANLNPERIAKMISEVGHEDQQINKRMRREELKLAETNRKLTEKFYLVMEDIETAQQKSIRRKAHNADLLARQTYQWLTLFSAAVTLLAIIVLFTVARYIRKSIAYQRALEHSKKEAEQLARTKEIFTANVSHEIRTPLNAIYGFLRQVDESSLESGNREIMRVVRSSSENLLQIVNDVLDFSKLEAGKIQLEKRAFELKSILNETHILFNDQALANNSTLTINIDDSVSRVYLGDPHRLKQIVFNLVSNAIKFTRNGSVSVTAGQIRNTDQKDVLILTVSDTGIGISPEKTELIFEDYTQAEAGTTQQYGGTGLGLSIVKKITELFGGTISVESKLKEGSKFICQIPVEVGTVAQLPKTGKKPKVPEQVDLSNYKALIVDDEEYNRMLLRRLLQKWKLPFDEASNGLEAIELLKTNSYSIALLDIRMPVLDGRKAARFVRESLRLSSSELPLIAVTAAAGKDEMKQYLSDGFNDVINKPFNENKLFTLIQKHILKEPVTIKKTVDENSAGNEKSGEIDFNELIRVSNNDKGFVKEMLEMFINSFSEGIEQIDSGLKEKNYHQVSETAHKIASPCRHLGAQTLLRITKEIEAGSNGNQDYESIPDLLVELKTEFRRVEKQIMNKLADLK